MRLSTLSENQKKAISLLSLLAIMAIAFMVFDRSRNTPAPVIEDDHKGDDIACIQVITPARNMQTGEVRDFPTPCDVPEGWEKIQQRELYDQ